MSPGDETVLQGGRAKAYRPLPAEERRAAIEAGLAAYARGDWFLAHELLEPAWMGTRDLAERELIQGVIKLAAAFVHGARSNPAGIEKNLRGARDRVANGVSAGAGLGIDAEALLASIDRWLANPSAGAAEGEEAIEIRRFGTVEAADARPIPLERR
jgi:predicted metal-dependent hydrolase